MKFFTYLFSSALLFTFAPPLSASNLTINELMQSNIDCILDDFNEFPDSWVELYNGTDQDIDLSTYSIGLTDDPADACALPAQTVKPGEFVVVYCDKQDEVQGLHMTFRIDSAKGACVYIFNNGTLVDSVSGLKKQPAPNVAYGKLDESTDTWGYQATPTPGAANCGQLVSDVLDEPKFSTEGGVFTSPVELTLTLPKKAPSGSTIHYTLDGTEPTEDSPAYEEPIDIQESTVVRAKLFCDGYLSPISTTHSYLMPDHDITLPIVSIAGNPDYFYDDELGILVEGTDADNPNYENDWRRPVNIEFFPSAGKAAAFNQLSETRVKGNYSRQMPLKSLVMYANKRFGTKRFTYEFFPEHAPGLTEWKSFELRNAGNDFRFAYMRDIVIQQTMGTNADLDWQPAQQSVLMINGEYKGILNLRPRSNEDFVYTYYDGLEDIEVVENWAEFKAGDGSEFRKFRSLYNNASTTAEQYREAMDVDEFFNLMIMNLYFANADFPGNNIVQWRQYTDGAKWRWIAKDADLGLGLGGFASDYKMLDWIVTPGYDSSYNWGNTTWTTKLYISLLAIDEFKQDFINKFIVYMGDFLKPATVNALVDYYYNNIKDEYPYHCIANGRNNTLAKNVETLKTWATERHEFFPTYLGKYFELGNPVKLTVNDKGEDVKSLTMNGIELRSKAFDGTHFAGSEIELTAADLPDNMVWEVSVEKDGEVSTENFCPKALSLVLPECDAVAINLAHSTGINSVTADATTLVNYSEPFEVYSISGISYGTFTGLSSAKASLAPGIYVARQGSAASKIIIK